MNQNQPTAIPPSQEPEMNEQGTISYFAQLWSDGCEYFETFTPARMAEDWDCLTQVFRNNMGHNHISLNISL